MFEPTLEGYVNLFTTRTRQTDEYLAANPPQNWAEEIVRQYDMVIVGPSRYGERFLNSIIIGFGSTFLSGVPGHASRPMRFRASRCR